MGRRAARRASVVIEARGLTKRYGDTVAVDGLDLSVHRGEIFGLLGPNGAGKTTTILMLLGLTDPSAGTVRVLGLDPTREALTVKSTVGYMPDDVGFYDDLSGRENLRYTAKLNRLGRDEMERRVEHLLAEVGLSGAADRPVGGYSRGMRQRLGLADALVKDPEILILDEPTVNIDPEGVRELLALVTRSRDERGVTVLLSSHLLGQVQATCDRVGVFVSGRLRAQGTVEELVADLEGRWVVELAARGDEAAVTAALAAVPGVAHVARTGERYVIEAERDVRSEVLVAAQSAGATVSHLSRQAADLEAVYHRYFGEHETDLAWPVLR